MSHEPETASGPVIDQPPPAPAPHRASAAGLLLALVVMLALVGTAPFWAPALAPLLPWSPPPRSEALAREIKRLDQRLGELAQRQAALDQSLARLDSAVKAAANPAAQQEMAAVLRQLNDRISELERRPNAPAIDPAQLAALQRDLAGVENDITGLGERIGKLEARASAAGGERSDQALLLAFNQLRSAVDSGRPYTGELAAVEKLGGGELQQSLQPLAEGAQQPLPTVAMLAQRFRDQVAPALRRKPAAPAAAAGAGAESWGDWLKAKLGHLVTIRHVGENGLPAAASDPTGAAVAKAEQALAANDLAGAVNAIAALPESEQMPARDWLAQARRRLAADAALARLGDELTARLVAAAR
jgi:hypothetical protein